VVELPVEKEEKGTFSLDFVKGRHALHPRRGGFLNGLPLKEGVGEGKKIHP